MLFKNGILAQNLAFMMKGPLTSDQVESFYQRLEERHAGAQNGNRPIIVDAGAGNVQTLGFSNREMEWMEGLKCAEGDMLTALGVREELYPGSQRTTYHNLSEARQEFYGNTVSSEWEFLEAGRQERFVPMLPERYRDLVLRFDTTVVAAMQESIDAKSTRELNEVRFGVRTPDEYRAERGMAPLADGAGAQPYVPSGTTPLTMLGEVPMPATAPQEPRALTEPALVAEVRCPTCSKLTGRDIVQGSSQFCRHCKKEFHATA
jgi:phage portal protein BeeE